MTASPHDASSVKSRLLGGSLWIALRALLQAIFAFWSIPLILDAVGPETAGAYAFALGFGFLKFLFDFGVSGTIQRQASEAQARNDRASVDRVIATGLSFYAAMALVQVLVLLAVALFAVPRARFCDASASLIMKMLGLQALTAFLYGLTMVVSGVLQAYRRYALIPCCESMALTVRFLILLGGLRAGLDFFIIVALMTLAQISLTLGPASWIMVQDLGYVPLKFGGDRTDFTRLLRVSLSMGLIQLSAVLSTNIDTMILGFALSDPGTETAVYSAVSKPFLQLRQTGAMLAQLVMPAAAGLSAARDEQSLEWIRYDLPRLHLGLLMPVALLAWIYAVPFLELWVGHAFVGRIPELAGLLRLFLVAALPLIIVVQVQAAIGMGKVEPIALAVLVGAMVNVPVSYVLTVRLGVAGVIWGTVLTSLTTNLLATGLYVGRALRLRVPMVLARTFCAPMAGATALILVTWMARIVSSPGLQGKATLGRLSVHLSLGCLAYLAGYLTTQAGRADLAALSRSEQLWAFRKIIRP